MTLTENDTQIEQENRPPWQWRRQPAGPPASSAESSLRGSETVLVVDDEPLVRRVITEILQSFGYRVLEACGALETQRLIGAGEKINLLLADFSMPETNVLALIQWLQVRRPDLKVLITTGVFWELANRIGDQAHVAILPKPFDRVELGRMVRLILSADGGLAHQR